LLLFLINTAKNYNGQDFRSFATKIRKSYKPTRNEFFLYQHHLHMILVILLLFSINMV